MTHQQALRQAHKLGITTVSHTSSKVQIIRAIQAFTGKPDCFACDGRGSCTKTNCEWRNDCQNHLSIKR